jgi:hypothetical protein
VNIWETTIRQGEEWLRVLESKDYAGAVLPIQPPGWADIRTGPRATAPRTARLHSTPGADGAITFDTPAGTATLRLPAAFTATMLTRMYWMDVWVHNAAAQPMMLVRGLILVTPRVSVP